MGAVFFCWILLVVTNVLFVCNAVPLSAPMRSILSVSGPRSDDVVSWSVDKSDLNLPSPHSHGVIGSPLSSSSTDEISSQHHDITRSPRSDDVTISQDPDNADGSSPQPFDVTPSPWSSGKTGEALAEKGKPCFKISEWRCWCYNDTANCSNSYLKFIPDFHNNSLQYLLFSYNNLRSINDSNFFQNVTNFTGLNLADNGLKYVNNDSFRNFTNLKSVILSYNYLSYGGLHPILSVRTLVDLYLVTCHLKELPNDLFARYHLPHLQRLVLNNNTLKHFNSTAFSFLPALEILDVAKNEISWIHAHPLPTLKTLNLKDNGIFYFPRTCNYSGSLFPKLKILDVSNNKIKRLPKRICLPALRWLALSGNIIPVLEANMFNAHAFPALVYLHLETMGTSIKRIEGYAFNNSNLRSLSLMYNQLDFSKRHVHQDSFQGCPNITELQISHNAIRQSSFLKLFGHLKSLMKLYMGKCGFKGFGKHTFNRFPNLVNLSLYRNELTVLPDGAFDNLKNLTVLDLSNNLIKTVKETTFSEATRKQLEHLDLSTNKFDCSCGLVWFRDWLVSSPSLFSESWSLYRCANIPNVTVASFHVVEQTCLLSTDQSMFMSITLGLLMLILTVSALTYRYRWHLRLVLHEAFRGKGDRLRRLQANTFQFDVFVSYAADDLSWVRTYLLPELEDRMGLKLCIHERDFIPGYPIVDNISDCVEASKKVLMVFSKHFNRSQWCQFELNFCLNHVINNDDALLVVCLQDLSSRDLTSAMMAVLNTTTYIQWDDDSDARWSFWGRIEIALQEVVLSNRS